MPITRCSFTTVVFYSSFQSWDGMGEWECLEMTLSGSQDEVG